MNKKDIVIILGTLVIACGFLLVDLVMPLGVAIGMLYVIPVYLSFNSSRLEYSYFIVFASFCFMIIGAVISPPAEMPMWQALTNRGMSLIIVIFIAFLGTVQKKIQEKINCSNQELSKQGWIKDGQVQLQESIKGEKSISEIFSSALNQLASYIGADVGVMYLLEDNKLRMCAGYSYPSDKRREVEFNEGIVGRTAAEKKLVRLNDVIVERMSLESSFGDMEPQEIMAIPFIYANETVAVVELAFPKKVDDRTIELLESIRDSLGISINSALSRDKVNKLLQETQSQAEELAAQQEELKASNEELQQKSVELEEQQRELEASNEELEEQRTVLEEQKKRLEETNYDLISTRKEVEQKAKDLETSSKYKSEFLANMSHELRTPLNSILILSKLLFEDKQERLNEDQKENAKTIYDSGNDLLSLINDILDLSKVEAGRLEINIERIFTTNLATNLDRAFRAQIEAKGLNYQIEIAASCPQAIYSDSLRLEQIIKNFISNSIKFTERGSINVIFDSTNDGRMSIRVKDTGIGIPDDKKQIIFEAFQQVDGSITRRFGGTGLGLSISRSLAEKLEAEIQVESKLDQGSTFTLIIPTKIQGKVDRIRNANVPLNASIPSYEEMEQINDAYVPIHIPDDRNQINEGDKVILVFESDRQLAEAISQHCHDLGYKCLINSSGELGLEDAVKYKPNSIIVDTDLSDQNGLIVLDRLKNNPQTRHIPAYVMSNEARKNESIKLGAVGLLDKNKGLENIPDIIKRLEKIYQKESKKVLLVEDNKVERESIKKLINERSIEVEDVATGAEAYELIKTGNYDCVILDLKLPDMNGFEFLDILKNDGTAIIPPVIVYTGKDLNLEEQHKLEEVSSSIVIKGVKSPERLLNEVTLFLHKMEAEMSEDKQKILKYARHREQVYEGKKVLIVDDDIRNVYSLKQVLQDRGMELFMASTGKEALGKIAEHPEIDIVLMDIMMPVMNGYEAMQEIRKTYDRKQLPILALTAKAMTGDRDKCLSSGANDYLPKPIDPDRLLSLLRVWLSQ